MMNKIYVLFAFFIAAVVAIFIFHFWMAWNYDPLWVDFREQLSKARKKRRLQQRHLRWSLDKRRGKDVR